ncbi:MAG: hypothetical protein ACK4E0_02475 [Chitinophagaceae bacterium]
MNLAIKLIFFLLIGALVLLAGYWLYTRINQQIRNSETGWQLLGYSLLLFVVLALLLYAGIFALVYLYQMLSVDAEPASAAFL